ncbi:hypothetical protein AD006_32080 (plasmid) [Pseudonocardia sp. EC080610-09]|uniref:SMP-30/gluconolactonase/LRE family protein n=1 Tax=unclassified Pseudonocardia TaxID=2619320 RepID=UPI0007069F69|nr:MULTISPECIES: SMP-30/gluconolactonase/LRE family protein [unclassified Pseudonocardia]ALL79765.1 hypothetical protein AD006_32080 [Pseudonocardia sp. EC080610-09]ALL85200.1 hypothetical protein AD017_28610 [Pseudonocardia sp. EC080619-01]
MTRFRIVAGPHTVLGEGPIWDVVEERLYWLDSVQGTILRCDAVGGELDVWDLPGPVGAMALRESGGALLTLATGFHLFDFGSGELTPIADPESGRASRFNDGKVDRQGRFVTGSMEDTLIDPASSWLVGKIEAGSSLYRVDTDLTVQRIQGDIGITNGPCFSPDGTTMYVSDSWRDEIQAFDYDAASGTVSRPRTFASWEKDKGSTGLAQPDGATVDSEGYLWSVAVYAGEIRRYAPDGTLDRRIFTPVLKPTSVAFGGPDLDILYVTTMANPPLPMTLPPDGPIAGSLLALHGLGVQGIAERRFAG